ncbi:uncharacterized protein C8Q71DRAFT_779954 [Rhodofomes roseus]|uniref:Uncharacterized protein n=1 Tax=Rhodofomes roseus TaxID=34475 RepID=A0ABQ8K472_9APHY|nr:uncharacterized protein C8Q71DRAFT_779954 [Rhodofomes roseus]KAH9831699.1 hypothetical protein C8Q71DRAFT_779954 [Rhodofomes roseus]
MCEACRRARWLVCQLLRLLLSPAIGVEWFRRWWRSLRSKLQSVISWCQRDVQRQIDWWRDAVQVYDWGVVLRYIFWDRPWHGLRHLHEVLSEDPSHNLQQLLKASDWLAHEQLCLGRRITHNEETEKSLFSDIYTIAQDTDVLRAMATCVRAMPIARAIKNVTEIGQAVITTLSTRKDSGSRRPSESFATPSGDQMVYEDLDGTATALIRRMVLDTFIRMHIELDDDTHALDSDYSRMLAGLIRAMPLADGHEACMSLFQHLRDGQLSTKQRQATWEVIQNVYITIDFLAEDEQYWQQKDMQKIRTFDCAPHTELYRLRDVQGKSSVYFGYNRCQLKFGIDWECVQTALTTVYAHRDPASAIQITTTALAG